MTTTASEALDECLDAYFVELGENTATRGMMISAMENSITLLKAQNNQAIAAADETTATDHPGGDTPTALAGEEA